MLSRYNVDCKLWLEGLQLPIQAIFLLYRANREFIKFSAAIF